MTSLLSGESLQSQMDQIFWGIWTHAAGYTKGIRPDFKAEDDLTHQLGDPQEGMMNQALEILEKAAFKM
jgi:hypothetical protein